MRNNGRLSRSVKRNEGQDSRVFEKKPECLDVCKQDNTVDSLFANPLLAMPIKTFFLKALEVA